MIPLMHLFTALSANLDLLAGVENFVDSIHKSFLIVLESQVDKGIINIFWLNRS